MKRALISKRLKGERAVASFDEDSLTMAVAAATNCLDGVDRQTIDGLFFASTTSPYKEKLASSIIAAALDLPKDISTADFTNSLRSGTMAMKSAMNGASPVLLEPIMKVKIHVPEDMTGSIMNDLTGKRGKILGMEKISSITQEIRAEVPLSEMLTYSIDLKAITSGKGTFQMELSHYKEFTGQLADKVIKTRQEVGQN